MSAVRAAAEICGVRLSGDELGFLCLQFTPGQIRGGNYEYDIGTAGCCALVLQTLVPALWYADAPSTVRLTGGTHNSAAPPADFLIDVWCH